MGAPRGASSSDPQTDFSRISLLEPCGGVHFTSLKSLTYNPLLVSLPERKYLNVSQKAGATDRSTLLTGLLDHEKDTDKRLTGSRQ